MASRRVLVLVVLLALLSATPGYSVARQDASPTASPAASPSASPGDGPLDLAALVLERGDLPDGFVLSTEAYADAQQFSVVYTGGGIPVEALDDIGFIRFYQSQYFSEDGLGIRSYASEYETEEGAAGGFALLEDESGFQASLPPGATLEDEPGPDVGEEPKETTVAIGTGFADGFDLTFRVDNVIVGVAVETYGAVEPDRALADALAPVLFDRAEVVLAGDSPAGADLDLPLRLLPFAEAGQTTQAGYLRADEVLSEAGADGTGYIQTVGLGFPSDPLTPVVAITAGILQPDVADLSTALADVDASDIFSILPPSADSPRELLPIFDLPDADAVVASRAALLPGGFADSARVTFLVGDQIGVVEVAGAATAAEAEVTALDLAARQIACLAAGDPCTDAPVAEDLQAATLRVPVADAAPDAAATPAVEGEVDRQAVFDEVWTTVKQFYVYRTGTENAFYVGREGVDWAALRASYEPRALAAPSDDEFYAVVAEMVAQLDDDHSRFLTPDAARADDAANAGEGTYTGIGVQAVGRLDPARAGTVLSVFPDSPAEEVGIQVRDRIVAVNGQPYDREAFAALVSELAPAGAPDDTAATPAATPAGTESPPTVQLTVASPGEAPRELTVEIRTGPALFAPVAKRLESAPGIGYLQIPELNQPDMGQQIEEGLAAMLEEGPLDGLIVDLRSNPGGFIDPAVNQFVSGEVGAFYNRNGTRGEPAVVVPGGLIDELADVPLVVLVDNRSNSASEIAAAILQSQRGAIVVGTRSPGNVEAVPIYDLADGSRLYLASYVFRVPGQDVEVNGVVPDVPVDVEWTAYPEAEDPQILTAAGLLQSVETLEEGTPIATPAT